jgi:hypothetical protein
MDAARKAKRIWLRPVCLLAVIAAGLTAGPAARPGQGAELTVTQAAGTSLTSLTLTSVGSGGQAANAASTQADVAADGGYAAFQSRAGLPVTASVPQTGEAAPGVSRVYVHGLVTGTTTLLSDAGGGDATAPGISADGKLVSYEQDGDVYLANRQASGSGAYDGPGNLVLHRVTSTPNDLHYEHVTGCPAVLGSSGDRITPCGPRLSADGSTLVYPAELTPVSPELSVTASFGDDDFGKKDTADGGFQPSGLAGDMLDFTPYVPGDFYGNPGGGEATVTYTNIGNTPMSFPDPGGVTVTEPPGEGGSQVFGEDDNCSGDILTPGESCSAFVFFDPAACTQTYANKLRLVSGDLVTHASTPAGQSSLELTGFCDFFETGYASRAAGPGQAGCATPPKGLALYPMPAMSSDDQGAPLADAGAAEIGRPYLVWTTLQAPQGLGTVRVMLQNANGPDCHIQLVDPASQKLGLADPLPANAPAACFKGEHLRKSTSWNSSSGQAPLAPPTGMRNRVFELIATAEAKQTTQMRSFAYSSMAQARPVMWADRRLFTSAPKPPANRGRRCCAQASKASSSNWVM